MTSTLFHTVGAKEATTKYTMPDLRAMQPIGRLIPPCPQSTLDRYVFTCKVVHKTPYEIEQATAESEEKKSQGRLARLREKLRESSRASSAWDRAGVQSIEGRYYCLSPEGEVLETVVCRRGKTSKMENLFGVNPVTHMVY